jgi:hypothetical protein
VGCLRWGRDSGVVVATSGMAFGANPGPPAHQRQVKRLLELLQAAGHVDFRDARGPLGLNQRQAGGRFTRDEADALIARLEAETEAGSDGGNPPVVPDRPVRLSAAEKAVQAASSELLAAELQRRGWVVLEP